MRRCQLNPTISFWRTHVRRVSRPDNSSQHLEKEKSYRKWHVYVVGCPEVTSQDEASSSQGQPHLGRREKIDNNELYSPSGVIQKFPVCFKCRAITSNRQANELASVTFFTFVVFIVILCKWNKESKILAKKQTKK